MTKQEFLSMSLTNQLKVKVLCGDGVFDTNNDLTVQLLYELGPSRLTPIVRHLDDLTKECVQKDYNNGEPFVPIEILGKAYEKNGTFEDGLFGWNCATGGDDYQDYYFTIDKTLTKYQIYCGKPDEGWGRVDEQNLSFLAIQQLLKWHFWPNMPEGEKVVYITGEFNPYK